MLSELETKNTVEPPLGIKITNMQIFRLGVTIIVCKQILTRDFVGILETEVGLLPGIAVSSQY